MEYQSLIQLNKTLLAKKVMTPLFLVSVSLFSLVFSDSCSWWCHSFSSLPMQLLSHAFDKTWIFLICNGIVVVIANTSSSITTVQYNNSSSPPPLDAKAANYNDVGSVIELLPEPGNAVSELLEEKENDVGEPEKIIYCITGDDSGELESEEDEPETCFMRMEEEEEDQDQDEDEGQVYDHDHDHHEYEYEEEGGEDGMDKLSTEELNKKFEDFITKMKEELRIQLVQQQQLILSY